MPTWPFSRPPTQPDRDAPAQQEKLLAGTHERVRQTTQRIEEVRELLYRIELVARRLRTSQQNGEDPPPRQPTP
jgi:hypothetical protein